MKSEIIRNEVIHVDLFAGVGGFAYGFEQSNLEVDCHYFSEIDKHAIAVYKYNFKNANYVGSVIDVSGSEIRKRHPNGKFIVTFGFPCQDLSVAGKGLGFDGKRSVLFFEAMRIVEEIKPEVFVFENVKGLLSHNNGETFEIVLRTIADLGVYECEWQLLNTRWVLPQNRERIYFIGHLRGASQPGVFPFREDDFENNGIQRIGSENITNTITTRTQNADSTGTYIIEGKWDAQRRSFVKALTETRTEEAKEIRKENRKNGRDWSPRRGKELRERNDYNANTITATQTVEQLIKIKSDIRKLTEIECERLQGFPDNWTEFGNYDGLVRKVLRTQRYRQMGNAITTLFAKEICNRIKL